jgi:hypothetical protein
MAQKKSKEGARLEKVSAEAQTISYTDIIYNSSEIAIHDSDFAELYLAEARQLLSKMTKGNKELYKRAVETVKAAMKVLKKT